MKHLHNFYNNVDLPWVKLVRNAYYYNEVPHAVTSCGSFWWKGIMKLADGYRQLTSCEVGNGSTVLFWSDNWKQHPLQETYPHLFSFAKDKLCSVKQALSLSEVSQAFHTPLSPQAMLELRTLQNDLQGTILNSEINDRWLTICTKNGAYIPKTIYKLYFSNMMNHFPSQWIWKSKCKIGRAHV